MKSIRTTFALAFAITSLLLIPLPSQCQDVHISTTWNHPLIPGSPLDSVLRGATSMRCVAFSPDIDGDGKGEIAVTNYTDNGRVHIFEVVGNDSIQLVWTSPHLATGGSSTPRCVLFGDLDNDGRGEVIYQSSGTGVLIFEWDGVVGSDNYGTTPSQVIATPQFGALLSSTVEYMEAVDVDGDGEQELLVAYNASLAQNDRYYVFSASGNWDTNDPGFSAFNTEFEANRTLLPAQYGIGGSPYALMSANLDGTGNKEILMHTFSMKNVVPIRVPSANTYVLADTTNGKQNIHLSGSADYVSIFGGVTCDIDNDGRDEVYFPTWYGAVTGGPTGVVHMVYYNSGSNTVEIDSAQNVVAFDLTPVIGPPDPAAPAGSFNSNLLGGGWGDIDGNGKKNLYFAGIFFPKNGFNIVTMEFQGGDKRNPANWTSKILYRGDSTIITAMTISDSSGLRDTTRVPWAAQVAHMYAKATDVDKDGKEDIIMPFQGWTVVYLDSITITRRTWNSTGAKFDSVVSKVVNPKRGVLRILEAGGPTGVEMKDLTVIMPEDYVLEQNYPNPFNPSTTIRFSLPLENQVSLKVYDLMGREIKTLISEEKRTKGTHAAKWDGTNNSGKAVASGTYIYTLKFGNFTKSGKMLLMK